MKKIISILKRINKFNVFHLHLKWTIPSIKHEKKVNLPSSITFLQDDTILKYLIFSLNLPSATKH